MKRFDEAFEIIKKHEGGFVDHPNDPGGATNCGISLRYIKNLKNSKPTNPLSFIMEHNPIDVDFIRNLTESQIKLIYEKEWWERYKYEQIIDDDLCFKVFDIAVNMGPTRCHKMLQESINDIAQKEVLSIDGILGSISLALINSFSAPIILLVFKHKLKKYYRDLARKNTSMRVFLKGWLNRAES